MTRVSYPPDPVHTVRGTFIREAEKAVLFNVQAIGTGELAPEDQKNHWFPKSQLVKIHTRTDLEDEDYIICKEWILREKSLLDQVSIEQSQEPEDSYTTFPWAEE